MMEGFLRQIDKMEFSKDIHWIIVPMVNVDGVELGNNRTGTLGHDFNRNWDIDECSKK
jgi:murein tripeptide amidase MpaA